MHGGTCTNVSTINVVVCGSTCAYDKYRVHGPKRSIIEPCRKHIGTDAVGKVHKGVIYADALQRGL